MASTKYLVTADTYAGSMTTTAVLLAAGGGSRFAGSTHKLLANIGGVPVFRRALDHVTAAGFDHVIVVTGAIALDIDEPTVTTVHNPSWQQGQAGSLRLAVSAAGELDSDFVVVGLADQPFVPASAWRAIANAWSRVSSPDGWTSPRATPPTPNPDTIPMPSAQPNNSTDLFTTRPPPR